MLLCGVSVRGTGWGEYNLTFKTVSRTSHCYSISALSELWRVAPRDSSLGRKKMISRTLPTGYIRGGGGPEGTHATVTVAFVLSPDPLKLNAKAVWQWQPL